MVLNDMPSRSSFGFADSDMRNLGEPRSPSWLIKILNFLQTTYSIVHIIYWLAVGCFLVFVPWQTYWEENYFVYRFPAMRNVMANPVLKWVVLVLGIVNLFIGFEEFVEFRKGHRGAYSR